MSRPTFVAGQEIVPGYKLVRRLGKGFSGEVWSARGAGGTTVALKVVELQKIGGRKELQALRTIRNVRHPNLCEVHAFWVRDAEGRLLEDGESEAIIPVGDSLELGDLPAIDPAAGSATETPFDPDATANTLEMPDLDATIRPSGESGSGQTDKSQTDKSQTDKSHTERGQSDTGLMATQILESPGQSPPAVENDLAATMDLGPPNGNPTGGNQTGDIAATQESGLANDPKATQDFGSVKSSGQVRVSGKVRDSSRVRDTSRGRGSGTVRDSSSFPMSTTGATTGPGSSRAAAEKLIIVMSLGDQTLQDRLLEVRAEHGLNAKDKTTNCGLDAEEAIRYIRSSASAIDLLMQKHRIMHGDIKPQNILLVGGEAQVCDFGLANKLVEDIRKTQHPFVSPAYGPPEMLDGTGYSKSADQYSLAVTYFELRTGTLPFDATTKTSILKAKTLEYFDLDLLSPAERQVLRKAMRVDPFDRYESCTEFANELAIAAGVDEVGGFKPLTVTAGALVLATVIGVAAWFLAPDSGKTTQQYVEEANGFAKAYVPAESYLISRVHLRSCLQELLGGILHAKPKDRSLLRSAAPPAIDALVNEIAGELNVVPADAGAIPHEAQIREDLALLDSVLGEHPEALVRIDASGDPIQQAILVTQTQFALLTGEAVEPSQQQTLRNLLANQSAAIADEPSLENNASAPEPASVVGFMTLALTHDDREPTGDHFVQPDVLGDIANAERRLDTDASVAVPSWMRARWDQMRNGQSGFLTALASRFSEGQLAQPIQQQIESTWPEIAVDAALTELKQLAETKRWDEFVSKTVSLRTERAEANGDSMIDRKHQCFETMAAGLGTPSPRNAIEGLAAQFQDADESLIDFVRTPVTSWLSHVSEQALASSTFLNDSNVVSSHSQCVALCKRLSIQVPLAWDRMRVLHGIVQRRESSGVNSDRGLDAAVDRLIAQNDPLGMINRSEREALLGRRLGEAPTQVVAAALDRPETGELLPNSFASTWIAFQKVIVDWHRNQHDATIAQLASIRQEHTDAPEILGPARVEFANKVLLADALRQTGATRERFYVSLIEPSGRLASVIGQMRWWNEAFPEIRKRFGNTREVLETIQSSDPQGDIPPAWGNRLATLLANDEPLPLPDRLFVRVTLDRAIATGNAPLAVDASTRMLIDGQRSGNVDEDWVRNVVGPTAATLLAGSKRSATKAPFWTLPSGLRGSSLRRFCGYVVRAEGMAMLGQAIADQLQTDDGESRYADAIEFASAIQATDPRLSNEDRYEGWIRAAEFFQEQMESRGQEWDMTSLKQFALYVGQARYMQPESNQVAILKGFATYQHARLRLADASSPDAGLSEAKELLDALERAKDDPPTLAYYNACWRHANLMVNLAFRQSRARRKGLLQLAQTSGERAIDVATKLDGVPNSHAAYMALGNVLEDLAHYCQWDSEEDAWKHYQSSIESFETAVAKTRYGQSLKPRYSLARCRLRYYQSSGQRDQLTQAAEDMGEFNDDASPITQIEWLSWNAQIQEALGQRDQALDQLRRADAVLSELPREQRDPIQTSELRFLMARLMSDSPRREDRDEAIELLGKIDVPPESETFWKVFKLQTVLLDSIGRDKELVQVVAAMPDSSLTPSLRESPASVSEDLASMALFVRRAAQSNDVSADRAAEALGPMMTAVDGIQTAGGSDAAVRLHQQVIQAVASSLASSDFNGKLDGYLGILDSPDAAKMRPILRQDVQRALLGVVKELFVPLSSTDRDQQRSAVEQIRGISATQRTRLLAELDALSRIDASLTGDVRSVSAIFKQIRPS